MKKFYFSISTLLLVITGAAQTPYPCTKTFDVINNGNGGQSCPSDHPDDPSYHKDGTILIRFQNAIGAAVTPPSITAVQKLVSGNLQNAADMKFVFRAITTGRTVAEYCFYSKNNTNLFNGNGVTYVFTIQYDGMAVQACDPIGQSTVTLPVSFTSFTAEKTNQRVLLKWTTGSEQNNSGFSVQRKSGSEEWKDLSFVASKSTSGSSSGSLSYEFSDLSPAKGIVQYRLKQVDMSGQEKMSEIRIVKDQDKGTVTVFPNPTKNGTVSIALSGSSAHQIQVFDYTGRVIKSYGAVRSLQQITGLARGQYLVVVTEVETGVATSEKVSVQ